MQLQGIVGKKKLNYKLLLRAHIWYSLSNFPYTYLIINKKK